MGVQAIVESLDTVPESLREFYLAGDDGKFRLDGIEDTSALKRSLENAKRERNDAKLAMDKLKGVDPEEYARLKQEAADRELQTATKKGEYEKLKQQLIDQHKAEISSRDGREKTLMSALERHLVDGEAARALAAAKGATELLLPHVRAQVKVLEEDGQFVTRVVDKDGNARIGDASGQPMTISQLVAEMQKSEVFGRAFESDGQTGGGATQNRSGPNADTKTVKRERFDAMTQSERATFSKDGGKVVD